MKEKTPAKKLADKSVPIDAQKVAEIAAAAAVEAVGKVLGPTIGRQASALKTQTDILANITGRLETLELGNIEIDSKKEEEDDL